MTVSTSTEKEIFIMTGKLLIPMAVLLLGSICGCVTANAVQAKSQPGIVKVYHFLKHTKVYYLATVEGDQPRVRPFGTALIYEGRLYIQTGRKKNVSKQIAKNGKVELCAFDGQCWMRLSGTLVDDNRREAKAAMLNAYPSLKKMYSADDHNTQVLYFKNATAVFYSFGSKPITVKF